jgi:hypothetical protein
VHSACGEELRHVTTIREATAFRLINSIDTALTTLRNSQTSSGGEHESRFRSPQVYRTIALFG